MHINPGPDNNSDSNDNCYLMIIYFIIRIDEMILLILLLWRILSLIELTLTYFEKHLEELAALQKSFEWFKSSINYLLSLFIYLKKILLVELITSICFVYL